MIKKKKLLILNGSHSEIPLIKSAKSLGFYVITTGNYPKLIGHQYSDEYWFADYSDKGAVLDIAKKLNVDAVCSCANDFGIITASYVSKRDLFCPFLEQDANMQVSLNVAIRNGRKQ